MAPPSPRRVPAPAPAAPVALRGSLVPLVALFAALASPAPAAAQCSAGQALYHDCLGVSFNGCCTLKDSDAGIVTTVQWCENGWLCAGVCNPFLGQVCGWYPLDTAGTGVYDCTDYQSMDPTGLNPYLCQIPCGGVTAAGCCEGQTLLKFCKDGSLNLINCAANAAGAQFCGWDPVKRDYTCTVAAIPGPAEHPYACGAPPACVAQCAGRACGGDGCGGSCGTCPANASCNETTGQCVTPPCVPQCTGRDCGPDGCGGSCGTCPGAQVCNQDQVCAAPPCQPDCANKECGSDLCGGSCGACMPPYACAPWFKCVDPAAEDVQAPDAGAIPDVPDAGERPLPDGFTVRIDPGTGGEDRCAEGWIYRFGSCIALPSEEPVPPSRSGGCSAAFHHR